MNWLEVYRQAVASGTPAAGYYHHNILVDTPSAGPVIVRIPIPGAEMMDLHIWDEPTILTALDTEDCVPRLLHVSADPPFQVHAYISGTLLNDIAPRGNRIPEHILNDIPRLLADLTAFPASRLPALPDKWPQDGDTASFAKRLAEDSRRVYEANRELEARLYERLAIPEDPFTAVDALWAGMTSRPFVLVHSDIHRKNIIIDSGRSYFLDWELALYGDPVYDLAVHLHKFGYQPDEEQALVDRWAEVMPSRYIENYATDLQTYLIHEQIKSVLVDSVRYADAFAGGPAPYPLDVLAAKLADMLATARRHWGDVTPVYQDEVAEALKATNTRR